MIHKHQINSNMEIINTANPNLEQQIMNFNATYMKVKIKYIYIYI